MGSPSRTRRPGRAAFPLSLTGLAIGLVAWACAGPERSSGPIERQAAPTLAQSPSYQRWGVRTFDEEMAAIAVRAPGFAGMFWDSVGRLVIKTTPDADPSVVLMSVADPDVGTRFHGVQDALGENRIHLVADAAFDFRALMSWRDALRPALRGGGVVASSIDEVNNAILIVTTSGEAERRIRDAAVQVSIPVAVLSFERGAVARLDASIRDRFRPIPGGVQVVAGYGGACTLGANVITDVGAGFITASHCTEHPWSPDDSGEAYQQTSSGSNYVGDEASDPTPETLGTWCDAEDGCRYSDAAFILYDSSYAEHGYIARTTGSGSTTISIWNPRFEITDEDGWLLVGADVDKMGRTTGWTWGEVTETCVDVDSIPTDGNTLLCQTETDYTSDYGDSGGPVFTWPLSGDSVTLRGTHVGFHTRGERVYRIFSNWTYIALEIGYDVGALTAVSQ